MFLISFQKTAENINSLFVNLPDFSPNTDKTQRQNFWGFADINCDQKTKKKKLKCFFVVFPDITGNDRNEKQDLSFQLT